MRPILFNFGGYALHTYGVLVALGFVAGLWFASRNARRDGLNPEWPYDLAPWLIIGAIVGARLLYVISYWRRDFAGRPLFETMAIWKGGLVYYGGLAGAVAAGVAAVQLKRWPVWRLADALAPGIPLGQAFGRLGCLMNGCCYGLPCSLPWAITYPPGHETYPPRAAGPTPVHPVQIYESLLSLALFCALMRLHPRRRFNGQVSAAYLAGYAVLRSVCEFFRGDYDWVSKPLSGVFTPGQGASVVALAAAAGIWAFRRHSGRPAQAV